MAASVSSSPPPSRRAASPPFSPPLSPPLAASKPAAAAPRPATPGGLRGRGLLARAAVLDPRAGSVAAREPRGVGTATGAGSRVESGSTAEKMWRNPSGAEGADRGAAVGRSYTRLLTNLQLATDITYELHTQSKSVAARAGARRFRNRVERSASSDSAGHVPAVPLLIPPPSAGFTAWVGEPDDAASCTDARWWKHPRPDGWPVAAEASLPASAANATADLRRRISASRPSSAAGLRAPLPIRPESAGYAGCGRTRPLSASHSGASFSRPGTAVRGRPASRSRSPGAEPVAAAAARRRRRSSRAKKKKGTGQLTPELPDGGKAGLLMLLEQSSSWC